MNNEWNFSGGPGVLPTSVLQQAQQAIAEVPEVGLSILGISHRSDWFAAVVAEAEANIRRLLGLPDGYAVLFLQGGATLQWSMIPMLLLRGSGKSADYLRTGYWSAKALPEAALEGPVRLAWDGSASHYHRLPHGDEAVYDPHAAYLHCVSNETVEGIQFHRVPGCAGVPLVCDMSSDFLSRPIEVERYDIIYAHAQKNLGPAGVTVAIVRKALLEHVPSGIPALLDYRTHLKAKSIYNTPPVFAIYVVLLVTRWLRDHVGGLAAMDSINQRKAQRLYDVLDTHPELYAGWAEQRDRSLMNVVFKLPTAALEQAFLQQAEAAGFSGLHGHRSLGGVRASIYNAMPEASVQALCDFMRGFAHAHAA